MVKKMCTLKTCSKITKLFFIKKIKPKLNLLGMKFFLFFTKHNLTRISVYLQYFFTITVFTLNLILNKKIYL